MSPNEFELSSSLKHLPTGSKTSTEYREKARVEPIAKYRDLRVPVVFSFGIMPELTSEPKSSIMQWSLELAIGLAVQGTPSVIRGQGVFVENNLLR